MVSLFPEHQGTVNIIMINYRAISRLYLTIAMNGEEKQPLFMKLGIWSSIIKDTLRISHKWIEECTEGEDFVRLMDLFPGYNYRHTEMTKADGALSMGLESLFEPQIGQEQKSINGKVVYKNMDDEE